jgi:hypothetical protein
MATWRDAHPAWEYTVWDERAMRRFRLTNARLYRRLCDIGRYDGASDVARAEILLRRGGVWVDADSECLRPLDGAPFMDARFFAVQDPVVEGGWAVVRELLGDVEYLVAGGFMGAEAGHPIMRRYVEALSRVLSQTGELTPTWITTGGVLMMKVIGDDPDAQILPAWTFFDRNLKGKPVIGGEPYGRHFWGSTAGREGHEEHFSGAVPYPGQPRGSIPDEYDARSGVRSFLHRIFQRGLRVIWRPTRD